MGAAPAPGLMLPSLPQVANHHIAQREHNHHQHLHQHNRLHRRQDREATTETVTEITQVQTVSVIQQIYVDSNGSTFSTCRTEMPTRTDSTAPILTSASVSVLNDAVTAAGQSPLILSSTSLTSTPSASTAATTSASTFASLLITSNSTSSISSSINDSSSQSHLINSTAILSSSHTKSSLTYLTSSSPSGSTSFSTLTSSPSYLSSPTLTSTDSGASIVGGGTAAATGAGASSTSNSTNSSNKSSSLAPTPVIIGSVVSTIAGAAVIILVLLFVWRWRKRTRTMLPLGSRGSIGEGPQTGTQAIREPPPPTEPPGNSMVERRSFAYAFPAALASLTGYKRSSQRTETGTISSTAGSERGFYRISGRKLPSVLQSGGDGYGNDIDDRPAFQGANTLSGTSFYIDSQGIYGGPGSPALPSGNPIQGRPTPRDSGIPIMRPSPARTPVTEQGFFPTPPLLPPANYPDHIGRPRPSRDGSHASKFTEEV